MGVVMYILLCGYPPFYSMKGLPFSPGMKDRITVGLYAFPHEDWDPISLTSNLLTKLHNNLIFQKREGKKIIILIIFF